MSDNPVNPNDVDSLIGVLELELRLLNTERDLAAARAECERLREDAERAKKDRDDLLMVIRAVMQIPNMSDLDLEQLRQNAQAVVDAARKEGS